MQVNFLINKTQDYSLNMDSADEIVSGLKNENNVKRMEAASYLAAFAAKIGPEKTLNDMIPFIRSGSPIINQN